MGILKRIVGFLVAGVIIMILLSWLLGNRGGKGTGNGSASEEGSKTAKVDSELVIDENAEDEGLYEQMNVKIEVQKGKYYIQGKEVTLDEIKEMLDKADEKTSTFVLEDNYGSAKAWDEIKKLFAEYGVSVIEN